MEFDCKEISINDEEFGCTVTFSEDPDDGLSQMNMSIKEIMESTTGQYLLLQRTYPEDELETDYYYLETSNPDKLGELKNFDIDLYRTRFLMKFQDDLYDLSIHISDNKFEKLKKALKIITYKRGKLITHD